MLLLHENVPAGQRLLLRKWRVQFRAISLDLALAGTSGEDLIPALRGLARRTLFSLDRRLC